MSQDTQIDYRLVCLRIELEPALNQLIPLLHHDLKRLASSQRRRFGAPPTLSTTAVVNELYLKLVQSRRVEVDSRQHFFALAALAMRQILTDHARRRMLAPTEELDEREIVVSGDDAQRVIEIDAILERLGAVESALGRGRQLPFFCRLHRRRDGDDSRHFGSHRAPRVGKGAGVAGLRARGRCVIGPQAP